VVDAELDRAPQHLDGVRGVAVLQLHRAETNPENIKITELSVRVRR